MDESKEWLVADDWKLARGTIEEARRNLTRLQHNLTPDYCLEGELVHFLDLLWPQYEYDQNFTRMDCLIVEMSEQVIEECVDRELIKDIKADDRRHSLPGNFSIFIKEETSLIALCVSISTPRNPVGGLAARYQQFV